MPHTHIAGFPKLLLTALAMLLLTAGGSIYLLFRSTSLVMFKWIDSMHMRPAIDAIRMHTAGIKPSDFILYTLPDALWLIAYLLIVNAVVSRSDRLYYIFWLTLLPALAIAHELLQGLHILPGVFDIADLICYIIPLIINLILFFNYEKNL